MPIKLSDIFGSGQDPFSSEKLEEVFNKTKDVAETMSKKSAERLELSKKKVELFDTRAKLSKLYEKYGKLQYGVSIGDEIGQGVLSDCETQIAQLREKAEEYTRAIEEAKAAFNESMAQVAKRTREAFSQDNKDDENSDSDAHGDADVIVSQDNISVEDAE